MNGLLSHAHIPFFILSLIPLAAHAYIGSFSRFVADDFSSATLAVNKGVPGATWDWYVNWSGRFTASFFDSLAGYIGPSVMCWETGTAIFLCLAGMVTLAWQLFRVKSVSFRLFMAVFLPALILVAAFDITPDLPQSLYWGQGMRSLIFPLVPASFLASSICYLLISPSHKISRVWLMVIGLISFIAGGFGETYVVIQTSVYGLSIILVYFSGPAGFRKKSFPVLLTGLICSLAAMAVTIAAPGNRVRQAYFLPSPDILNLLFISARSYGAFLQSTFSAWNNLLTLMVLLLASIIVGYLYAKKKDSFPEDYRYPVIFSDHPFFRGFARKSLSTLLLVILLTYVCFVPAAYGMSTPPPDRTLIIPLYIFCIFLAIFGVLLGSQVQADNRFSFKFLRGKSKWIVWLLFFCFSFYVYRITTNILAVQSDYRRFASVFDRADRLIREAKSQGKTSVMVPEVHNHFGFSDFGAGTTYWLDEAVDSYYGIDVIVNKNMK